jgi:hypothetical protein
MQVPSFRVDAFTSAVFTGNPSAMCPFRRAAVTVVLPCSGKSATESGSLAHDYDLGYIELEEKALQRLDNPFGPRLSPMS